MSKPIASICFIFSSRLQKMSRSSCCAGRTAATVGASMSSEHLTSARRDGRRSCALEKWKGFAVCSSSADSTNGRFSRIVNTYGSPGDFKNQVPGYSPF